MGLEKCGLLGFLLLSLQNAVLQETPSATEHIYSAEIPGQDFTMEKGTFGSSGS